MCLMMNIWGKPWGYLIKVQWWDMVYVQGVGHSRMDETSIS